MGFKASKAKSGLFEVHGLEDFIEKKLAELKAALGMKPRAAGKKAAKKATTRKPASSKPAATKAADPLAGVLAALEAHPKRAALIKAGKQKDQLLRSLIPLYVAPGVDISSGTTSKFWAKHGVKFAAPNAAKALREHVGFARRTARGVQITPNGIKYVDEALAGKRKAA